MTSADWIPVMTERIVQQFHPLKIILFGSHARGQARPDSDVDLLVVLPECDNKRTSTIEVLRILSDLPVPTDIIVTTPEEIALRGDAIGTVLRPALREGKVLYEHSCSCSRSTVEKVLKAGLLFSQREFPFTHNLDTRRNLLPDGWNVKSRFPELGSLTVWATEGRYPGDWPDADVTEARTALADARAVWETVLNDLRTHGFDPEQHP